MKIIGLLHELFQVSYEVNQRTPDSFGVLIEDTAYYTEVFKEGEQIDVQPGDVIIRKVIDVR